MITKVKGSDNLNSLESTLIAAKTMSVQERRFLLRYIQVIENIVTGTYSDNIEEARDDLEIMLGNRIL